MINPATSQVIEPATILIDGDQTTVAGRAVDDLSDPPIVKIDTAEQGREMVRKLAAQNPDYVKVWYIVDVKHPLEKFRLIVHAVVEESHARKLRVAVHATELEAARAAVCSRKESERNAVEELRVYFGTS